MSMWTIASLVWGLAAIGVLIFIRGAFAPVAQRRGNDEGTRA